MQVFIKINLIILLIFFYVECAPSSSSNHRHSDRSTNGNGESSRHRSRDATSQRTEPTGVTLLRYFSGANVRTTTRTSRTHTRNTNGTSSNRSSGHQRESNRQQHRRRDNDDHENVRRTETRSRQPEVINRPPPRVPTPPSPSPSPPQTPSPPTPLSLSPSRSPSPRSIPNENNWNQYRPPSPPRPIPNENYRNHNQHLHGNGLYEIGSQIPLQEWDESDEEYAIRFRQFEREYTAGAIRGLNENDEEVRELIRQIGHEISLREAENDYEISDTSSQVTVGTGSETSHVGGIRHFPQQHETFGGNWHFEPQRNDVQVHSNSDTPQVEIEGRPVCMKCNQTIIIHPEPIVMVLLCGHTYCKNCADTLFRRSGYVHCPNCSKTVYERDNLRAYFDIKESDQQSNRSPSPITVPTHNPNLTSPQRPNESDEHFRRRTAAARAAENRIRNPNMDAPSAPITIPNRQPINERNIAMAYLTPPVQRTFESNESFALRVREFEQHFDQIASQNRGNSNNRANLMRRHETFGETSRAGAQRNQQQNERERQPARPNVQFSKPYCSICIQTIVFNSRTVNILRCGHTFCNNCLVSHYQHPMSNGSVTCPICRTEITHDTYRKVLFKFDNRPNAVSHH